MMNNSNLFLFAAIIVVGFLVLSGLVILLAWKYFRLKSEIEQRTRIAVQEWTSTELARLKEETLAWREELKRRATAYVNQIQADTSTRIQQNEKDTQALVETMKTLADVRLRDAATRVERIERDSGARIAKIQADADARVQQIQRDATKAVNDAAARVKTAENYAEVRIAEIKADTELRVQEIDKDAAKRAIEEARLQFEIWKQEEEVRIRQDAISRSRSVVSGKVSEHFMPFLPDFQYNPKDARFLGSPIDFVVFDGLSDNAVQQVVFVEVKTGRSAQLQSNQRSIRDCIANKQVNFELIHLIPQNDQHSAEMHEIHP